MSLKETNLENLWKIIGVGAVGLLTLGLAILYCQKDESNSKQIKKEKIEEEKNIKEDEKEKEKENIKKEKNKKKKEKEVKEEQEIKEEINLSKFAIKIGQKVILSKIMEKDIAEEKYKEAIESGNIGFI